MLAPVFARYAYPEVFFAARVPLEPHFLARESRLPSWAAAGGGSAGIRWFRNADVTKLLRTRVLSDAGSGRHCSIFALSIGGTEYQVVTRFLGGAADGDSPMAVLGFLVNMDWARAHYFVPMLESVIAGSGVPIESQIPDPAGVEFALLDQHDRAVGGRPEIATDREPTTRRLNAYFFDPAMANTEAVHDLQQWVWAVQVSAAVASMRSEFVSTVTHELKTPMSVIQSVGETMLRGRVSSPEQQREYPQLLVQETYRLRRLVDNLLAYARVTEVADVYTFEPLQPEQVVEEVLHGFRRLLRDGGIEVNVSVPGPLPR